MSGIQTIIPTLLVLALSFWISISLIPAKFTSQSDYTSVNIHFKNTADVRVSDYLIKEDDGKFLIAPNAPRELKLGLRFLESGSYRIFIKPQYPTWKCSENELDKATINVVGGSLNQTVPLIRGKVVEKKFTIASGQSLGFTVINRYNNDCGRALVKFKESQDSLISSSVALFIWMMALTCCLVLGISNLALVFGLLSSASMIAAEASLGALNSSGVVFCTAVGLSLTGFLILLTSFPRKSILISLIGLALVLAYFLIPASFIGYFEVFKQPMTEEAIHGLMQSYGSQAIEFWQEYVGYRKTALLLLILLISYFGVSKIVNSTSHRGLSLASAGLVISLTLPMIGILALGTNSVNLILKSVLEYQTEINSFQLVKQARKNISASALRSQKHINDTAVIVFGESVNKKHMSAYGYPRLTTPMLDKRLSNGDAIKFTQAYSNHTHSNPSVSLMLTQANQYNDKNWASSASLFNYLSAANVESEWLTNHRLLSGWSNQITSIASEADRIKTINLRVGRGNSSSDHDGDLLPLLESSKEERPNQVTFLHFYNSHIGYCNRYPKKEAVFEAHVPAVLFGKLSKQRAVRSASLACYDNTILYTDSVLEKIITKLDARQNPSMVIYIADHSEEVIDAVAHNSALFTFDMINIPLVIWANQAWREQHQDLWDNLIRNKDRVFTNDMVFESILGLTGIESESLNRKFDISSAAFISPSVAKTLHSRVDINHPNNWNYWQANNSSLAAKLGRQLGLLGARSTGEIYAALELGIYTVAIEIEQDQGEWFVVDRSDRTKLGKLMPLIKSLDKIRSSQLRLGLISGQLIPQDIRDQIALSTNRQITLYSAKNRSTIDLGEPNFKSRLMDSLTDFEPLWVSIKTRYFNKAPTPL